MAADPFDPIPGRGRNVVIHLQDMVDRHGAREATWHQVLDASGATVWVVRLFGCRKECLVEPDNAGGAWNRWAPIRTFTLANGATLDTDTYVANKVAERMEHGAAAAVIFDQPIYHFNPNEDP